MSTQNQNEKKPNDQNQKNISRIKFDKTNLRRAFTFPL